MRAQSTLKTHAALLDEMSRALGLDLQEEAIAGRLEFDEISEAVLRCSRCAHPGQCSAQLAQPGRGLSEAPDYCRNRDLLAYLKENAAQAAPVE